MGEPRLHHHHTLGGKHPGIDGQQGPVDAQRLSRIATQPGFDQFGGPAATEMGGGADHPDGADGQQRQQFGIVAGVIVQTGGGQHLRRTHNVVLGVLDPDDVRMTGQGQQ